MCREVAEAIDASDARLSIEPECEYGRIRPANAHARVGDIDKGFQQGNAVAGQMGTEAPLATLFALAGVRAEVKTTLSPK